MKIWKTASLGAILVQYVPVMFQRTVFEGWKSPTYFQNTENILELCKDCIKSVKITDKFSKYERKYIDGVCFSTLFFVHI